MENSSKTNEKTENEKNEKFVTTANSFLITFNSNWACMMSTCLKTAHIGVILKVPSIRKNLSFASIDLVVNSIDLGDERIQ